MRGGTSGTTKRDTFGVSVLSTARLQSPLARRDGGLPLPIPFTGAILASKLPGIWQMSVKYNFQCREESMKAAVRPVLAAFIASAAVLWSVAVYVPVALAQAAHIRWDIATF